MDDVSVPPSPRRRRRRHSPEFKARIIAACQESGVSVARVALDHGLNANMVRQWVKASRVAPTTNPATFVPLALPAPAAQASSTVADGAIRIEVSRAGAAIAISWPVSHADRAVSLLRELLL
ncbi:MAG: transposase [Pseudomonadota bacterium]